MIEGFNKIRRRIEQKTDQIRIIASHAYFSKVPPVNYDGNPRISIVTVNFNTLELTKLMLLTLANSIGETNLSRVVVVDNNSSDGSQRFLKKFPESSKVQIIQNTRCATHAYGLRLGIKFIKDMEQTIAPNRRTNLYLIVDSDIIFIRNDFLPTITRILNEQNAGLVGELQYDVGEPYVHPSCFLLRRDVYENPRIWSFVNHGAPALWLQRSMRKAGIRIVDFPVRSENYIVHQGRATVAAISTYAPIHSYATVKKCEPHFHGNPRGKELWDKETNNFKHLLDPANEFYAIDYIETRLQGKNEY